MGLVGLRGFAVTPLFLVALPLEGLTTEGLLALAFAPLPLAGDPSDVPAPDAGERIGERAYRSPVGIAPGAAAAAAAAAVAAAAAAPTALAAAAVARGTEATVPSLAAAPPMQDASVSVRTVAILTLR